MNKYGILFITGLIALILLVFWPSDKTETNPSAVSATSTSPTGDPSESRSSYRKVEARELSVGTHLIRLEAGVKSETFTFASDVKGFRYDFSTTACRQIYGNSNSPVRNCGSDRVKVTKPGETITSIAFKASEDMDVVIKVR